MVENPVFSYVELDSENLPIRYDSSFHLDTPFPGLVPDTLQFRPELYVECVRVIVHTLDIFLNIRCVV